MNKIMYQKWRYDDPRSLITWFGIRYNNTVSLFNNENVYKISISDRDLMRLYNKRVS